MTIFSIDNQINSFYEFKILSLLSKTKNRTDPHIFQAKCMNQTLESNYLNVYVKSYEIMVMKVA